MSWVFSDYELDAHRYRLLRAGDEVRLEPKAFDVLVYLIQRCERVVGKEELLERLWPGQIVSDTALTFSIRAIRRALGDDGKGQNIIRTVYGRGYQFVATCREKADTPPAPEPAHHKAGDFAPLFVGRKVEMQRLCAAYGSAAAGRGSVWMLAGEAGVGKSRVAAELAAWCARQGAEVYVGRCYDAQETPAYWPWAEILRRYTDAHSAAQLRDVIGAGSSDLVQMAPVLREKLQLGEPRVVDDSPNARLRLFDSLAGFIARVAARNPLVLILDDLHAADDASLLLLEMIGGGLRETRSLVLGTYRDAEVDQQHPLQRAMNTLRRSRCLEQMALPGVVEADVYAWLDAVGGHRLAADLAHRIYAHTEGNPFFIEQTLHHLTEEGVIHRNGGLWDCDVIPANLGVPAGVRDVLLERMQRLSLRCIEALRVAAVAGRDFTPALVTRVIGVESHQLDEALHEAERAGFVHSLTDLDDRYAFVHALMRQALYEQLRPARRRAIHRQLAEAIEAGGGIEPEAHMSVLAHHSYLGAQAPGSVDKAIVTERRAAEHAGSRYAYEESLQHYKRALTLLDRKGTSDQKLRCELILAQGHAALRARQASQARIYFHRAADLAREIGEGMLFAQAALGVGLVYENVPTMDNAATLALLEEALRTIGNADSALRVQLLCQLSTTAHFTSTPEYREALAQEALEIARRLGDRESLIAALKIRYHALTGTPDAERRLVIASEALSLAEEVGQTEASLYPRLLRFTELLILGDAEAAEVERETLAQLAEESRDQFMLWATPGHRAAKALLEGRFAECEDLIRQSLSLGQRVAESHATQTYYVQMSILRVAQGRLHEIESEIDRLADQTGTHPFHGCLRALIVAERGPREAALRATQAVSTPNLDITWTCSAAALSLAYAAAGDAKNAAVLYDALLPYEKQAAILGFGVTSMGAVARYLGKLAETLGRFEVSLQHYETAIEVNTRSRSLPWLAHTQHDYAQLLLTREDAGSGDRARELLGAALETAEDIGMFGMIESMRGRPPNRGKQRARVSRSRRGP